MKIVYIAGAFTAPTSEGVAANVRAAELLGAYAARRGLMPLIPQANTRHPDFVKIQTPEFWHEGTLELLKRCDLVWVRAESLPVSEGTRAEYAWAQGRTGPLVVQLWYRAKRALFGYGRKICYVVSAAELS